MKIFSWQAKVGGNVIADGYLLAKDRKEAEENGLDDFEISYYESILA